MPDVLGVAEIHRVLQGLLRERISVPELGTVMGVPGDVGRQVKDPDVLAERVRTALYRTITLANLSDDKRLHAVALTLAAEDTITESLRDERGAPQSAMEPGHIESLSRQVEQETKKIASYGHEAIVVCSPAIRLALRRLLERQLPHVPVLAYTEIAPNANMAVEGMVGLV